MADLSAGKASMPARIAAIVPERDALLAAMPAYLPSSGALTTKLVSLFPKNTDRPTHQAVIVVFDAEYGTPLALLDGEAITAARTAPASALAPDLLPRRGAHVTSVGYNTAGREVDGATFRDALVVVESRAATLAPPPAGSNDIAMAIAEGAMTRDHVHAELGELVSGTRPGRTDRDQITLYKSVGVAVQDAAAAAMVLDAARSAGVGRTVDL